MRYAFAAWFLALGFTAAAAQSPVAPPVATKVAALSLIGDRLLVVGSTISTGSRIDKNAKTILPLATDEIDVATVLAFEKRANAVRPQLEVVLLRAKDPSIHQLQDDVVAGKRDFRELLSAVAPLARRAGATHLVLFAKSRGETKIDMGDGSIGTGYVDGVGFYVDRWLRKQQTHEGEAEVGILAPFAYFKAVVVDLDGLKIIGEEISHQAKALYPAANVREARDPWDYLSATEKVAALKTLSDQGVDRIAAKVLGRF
ncbi:hypothetical protein DSM104443_04167 [Usitatibacter rugosus]|uniref:Uncharacterized protein n=1 Tax=Usitatibacter rugosus TaxID=2732067 RepID=A0A6M4H2X6_9PROT|nr:hypothetical protein [Usitatibacter rugosus]QJR13073.1 hypothetical protein DSM104443_04167 [Usitatibacter rugosus]